MKKLLILVSCFVVVLILSKVSFAQEDAAVAPVAVASHTPDCPQGALPFGYPPYPTVGDYPAFGAPYSYPRAARRGARFAPPAPYQPYPLPVPGAVEGAMPPVANPVPPMYRGRTLPPRQGTLGAIPAVPGQPGPPNVFYRPTPVKNFVTLMSAPRPYIGYNPYAGTGLQQAPPFVPMPVQ